jgi:hypothetical protein
MEDTLYFEHEQRAAFTCLDSEGELPYERGYESQKANNRSGKALAAGFYHGVTAK